MNHETPAGYSRLLFQQVRALHAEMRGRGFANETVYVMLLDALMRLASEEQGEGRALAMIEEMRAGL